jgi:serine/threonine protein kinase/tetratricopeptide (TPR) repeat protein
MPQGHDDREDALGALPSERERSSQLHDSPAPATPGLESTITQAAPAGQAVESTLPPAAEPIAGGRETQRTTGASSRYRTVRFHARGGIGEVHLAEDGELRREVALKRIQPRHADNIECRRRFLLEAEITARLQHPGIVPVYGLIEDDDGQPCYAMRFIEGSSLKAAIDQFHGKGDSLQASRPDAQAPRGEASVAVPHASDFTSLEFRKLLGRFIDACNAIEYAHSRGVVHRDLKPANIMLGEYGETLVVDWGLAKVLGRAAGDSPRPDQQIEELRTNVPCDVSTSPPGHEPTEGTQQGAIIGTPQYMSPEQAEGRQELVGPASDVYGLGATLYSLLTGRTPFAVGEIRAVLVSVAKGQFAPPRQVNRLVPSALNAICLKAMAPTPAERYSSPRALANDVEHWLADEPASALPDSPAQRVARWTRRHRAVARAGAISLGAVTIMALAAVAFVNAARHTAETQRDVANTALRAEKLAKDKAKQAIDRYVEAVQEDPFLKDKRFEPFRKKLLSDALHYYQGFIQDHQHDESARFELAKALQKIGGISREGGSIAESVTAFTQAVELLDALHLAAPNSVDYQDDLAACYNDLAVAERDTGDRESALASHQRALAIWRKLADRDASVAEYQSHLAVSHNNLGLLQRDTGDADAALANFQQALAILEKLVGADPGAPEHQSEMAKVCLNVGLSLGRTSDREGALAHCRRALEISEKLVDDNPAVTEYQDNLVMSYINVGSFLLQTSDQAGALANFQRALVISQSLVDENPMVSEYNDHLARCHANVGQLLAKTSDRESALDHYQRALAIWQKLLDGDPTVTDYQSMVAEMYFVLGNTRKELGERDLAVTNYERGLDLRRQLVDDNPKVIAYQNSLAGSYTNLAIVQHETGDRQGALTNYQRALAILNKLHDENPAVTQYQIDLAGNYNNVGVLQKQLGDLDGALASYRHALATSRKLRDDNPTVNKYERSLAATCANLGLLQQEAGDHAGALASVGESLLIRQKLAAENPSVTGDQSALADCYNKLGNVQRKMGDVEGQRSNYQQALAIREKLADENPAVAEYQASLADSYNVMGVIQGETGDPEAQRASYQRALVLREKLAADNPNVTKYQSALADIYNNLGALQKQTGDLVGALDSYQRALAMREKLVADNLGVIKYQGLVAQSCHNLGLLHAETGDWAAALASYRQALAIQRKLAVENPAVVPYQINLACALACCSSAAKDDTELAERYATEALELLTRAQQAGYFADPAHVEEMKQNPNLETLRQRADFRKFLEGLPSITAGEPN